ncbi:hypothetical protein RUM44_012897 [Polyplax serrata]|uniref:Uncharacterized protein n=1 Tax=Polyplax serrata TaxID=468196 RepID=A0ABR1BCL4_POLSC
MPSIKERLGITELMDKKGGIWKALLAEFLGNLLLNFFGCASCLSLSDEKTPTDFVRISLAFGLVIFGTVQAFCHVSGAHLNPAVTAGVLVTGKIPVIKALFYIIVQCLGAVAGSAVLKALTPDDPKIQGNLGLTLVNPKLSPVQGFGVEFFLGFVLVMVVFGVCDSNRNSVHIPAPLAIGLTVGMGHLATIEMTGSSMNPARTFGSAVIANIWTDHWVYWLGPILGGMAAALIYQHGFVAPPSEEVTEYSPVRVEDKELKRMDAKDKEGLP